MKDNINKNIAVLSMARNDNFFISKWVDYYGQIFGFNNLFLILDGFDQPSPEKAEKINFIKIPHIKYGRSTGDRNRALIISKFAKTLFHRYDIVIACDIDELLVVDPNVNLTLFEYLQKPIYSSSLSALGLDVGQNRNNEKSINPKKCFLEQRNFAHVSARYTKPIIATRPLTWGSGLHRIKGKNFKIDPNLFLFHLGMVDYEIAQKKIGDKALLKDGWKRHFDRRYKLFMLIENSSPIDGDSFFDKARKKQSCFRPFYAINKPGNLKGNPIIKIPSRFKSIF